VSIGLSKKIFRACPYCLTELTGGAVPIALSSLDSKIETAKEHYEKKPEADAIQVGCSKHFGFLRERSSKDQIPDECLTCKDIMRCMAKKDKD